ncbi:hypothetical protein Ancab_034604 [Ancistrocladus abbreviatus]
MLDVPDVQGFFQNQQKFHCTPVVDVVQLFKLTAVWFIIGKAWIATYYRRGDGRTKMGSDELGHVQNDVADHVHDDRKSSSSNKKSPSDDQCHLEQDDGTVKHAFTKWIPKQLGGRDREASTSSGLSPLERKAPSQLPAASDLVQGSDSGSAASLSKKQTLFDSEKSWRFVTADGEVEGRDENINVNGSQEQLAIKNLALDATLSNEPTPNKGGDPSSKVEGMPEDAVENFKEEQLGVEISAHETISSNDPMPLENMESLQLAAENAVIDSRIDQDKLEIPRQTQLGGDSRNLSSSEINCYKRDSSLAEARTNKKPTRGEDHNESTGWVAQQLGNIDLSSKAVRSTDFTCDKNRHSPSFLEENMKVDENAGDSASPSTENIHTGCIAPEPEFDSGPIELNRDPHQQTHKPENSDGNEFKCGSDNTLGSTELFKAELQVDARNSFTNDGSISSIDGNDDEILCQNLQLDGECIGAEDKRGKCLARNMTNISSEIQPEANNHPAASPNKKNEHHPLKGRMSTIDGLLEGTRHRIQRNMRPQRGEFASRSPVCLRSSGVSYDSSSFSNYMHDEYPGHLMHHPPLRYSDPKSNFGRRYTIHNNNVDRIFPESSAEIYHDLRYQGYYGQKRINIRPHSIPRIPHSRETISSFHNAYGPRLHCHPHTKWCSSYLPPPAICCSSGQFMAHPSHGNWSCHNSLWSQQHLTDPETYAWGHHAFSDDQRRRDHMRRKLNLRKKNQPLQRHFRPIAGAAPFVTCYECSELLVIPTDHLLFRRSHQLKCGTCSRVLKFSLENGCHLVRHTPNTVIPHSEAVESGVKESLNSVSTSHRNHYPHNSLSHRSCSSVGGDQILNAHAAELPMHDSVTAMEKQKSKLETENFESKHDQAGTSSNQSRQLKVSRERPARSR